MMDTVPVTVAELPGELMPIVGGVVSGGGGGGGGGGATPNVTDTVAPLDDTLSTEIRSDKAES